MHRNGHAPLVGFTTQMDVTAFLSPYLKTRAFKSAHYLLAFNAREFLTHAAGDTVRRAIKNGSGSVGTSSPSSRMLSM